MAVVLGIVGVRRKDRLNAWSLFALALGAPVVVVALTILVAWARS